MAEPGLKTISGALSWSQNPQLHYSAIEQHKVNLGHEKIAEAYKCIFFDKKL
jgi:hypothetical protein